jgi:hypothetical protein
MQWNTVFWFNASKGQQVADDTDIFNIKVAKQEDICFGQESDVEIMDKLGNEIEFEDDSAEAVDSKSKVEGTIQLDGSSSDSDSSEPTLCEFSPSLSFATREFSGGSNTSCILDDHRSTGELLGGTLNSGETDAGTAVKHQHLRLVHGRLQVVGFNADCRDHSTNRSKLRRSRKGRTTAKPFWSELMYFLTK